MRKAVVLDKSGTIVNPCRVIYSLATGELLFHVSTLKYVVERGEALVNIRGSLKSLAEGNIQGASLKVSCMAFKPMPNLNIDSLKDTKVIDGIKLVMNEAQTHCNSQMGACAAVIVNPKGEITHVVGLGGRLYDDVEEVVQTMMCRGVDVFLATGNCKEMTLKCADLLNIPRRFVLFDASPEDKRDWVRKLRGFYGSVIMVGNDLNDLIAMKEADVSVIVTRTGTTAHEKVSECKDVDYIVPSLKEVEGIVEGITHP